MLVGIVFFLAVLLSWGGFFFCVVHIACEWVNNPDTSRQVTTHGDCAVPIFGPLHFLVLFPTNNPRSRGEIKAPIMSWILFSPPPWLAREVCLSRPGLLLAYIGLGVRTQNLTISVTSIPTQSRFLKCVPPDLWSPSPVAASPLTV